MELKEKAHKLPQSPGVYLMKDSSGNIIYVGKARNLKNRVQSYFQSSRNHTKKVERLVKHLKNFEVIQTDTEFEAFMLECQLIQELKPLYNRMMKNPHAYTYIVIRMDRGLPRIEQTTQINEKEDTHYFGPFSSKIMVEKAIKGLKEILKLDCSNQSKKNTPCLNYSLGLCMGVCFDSTAIKKYEQTIDQIISLFEGESLDIIEEMDSMMSAASMDFDFEKAAKIRDCKALLQSVLRKEEAIEFTKGNKRVAVLESIDEQLVKLFLIKRNRLIFTDKFEMNKDNIRHLGEWIKDSIVSHFDTKKDLLLYEVSKEEIDEAQIIYRYLQSEECKYIVILEEWLSSEMNHTLIDQAIHKLLDFPLKKL